MKPLLVFFLATCAARSLEPVNNTLASVKRVYVESLGGSPPAIMLHDMIVAALANSGFFSITENADHADAILRGSADDAVFNEQHHLQDGINAGLHAGVSSYSSEGAYSRVGDSRSRGVTVGENESSQTLEHKHEASAAVRLVNRDGDVIWSTTQESGGAKFRSASADVADKIFRKLSEDLQKARAAVPVTSTR